MVQELPVQVPLGNVVCIFPVSALPERKIQIEAESQSVFSVLHLILTCYVLCSFLFLYPCLVSVLAVTLFSMCRLLTHKTVWRETGNMMQGGCQHQPFLTYESRVFSWAHWPPLGQIDGEALCVCGSPNCATGFI